MEKPVGTVVEMSYILPEKPEMVRFPDFEGDGYRFAFEERDLRELLPLKTMPNIRHISLQCWLDHLGQAVYNPMTLLVSSDSIRVGPDGFHRRRALWEVGEYDIRFLVRYSESKHPKGQERSDHIEWRKPILKANNNSTARPHFRHEEPKQNEARKRAAARFFPQLKPWPQRLIRYCEKKRGGDAFIKHLDGPMKFRDIYLLNKLKDYRVRTCDLITSYTDISDKTILDLGCHFGHMSFQLLDAGAKSSLGVDLNVGRVKMANLLSARRQMGFHGYVDRIEEWLKRNDEHFDVCLFLNTFHHLLRRGDYRWVMDDLLDRCKTVFFTIGGQFGALKPYDGDVRRFLTENWGCRAEEVGKCWHRGRILYSVER